MSESSSFRFPISDESQFLVALHGCHVMPGAWQVMAAGLQRMPSSLHAKQYASAFKARPKPAYS